MVDSQNHSGLNSGELSKNTPEEAVPEELLDYTKALFDRDAADFEHLDNKTIGVMAVVGLLVGFQALNTDNLAYIFGAFSEPTISRLVIFAFCLLCIHGLALLATLIMALLAFQVRDIEYPCNANELIKKFKEERKKRGCGEVETKGDTVTDYARACLRSHMVKQYELSSTDIGRVNVTKASMLKWSVLLLIISIVALGVFVVFLALVKT